MDTYHPTTKTDHARQLGEEHGKAAAEWFMQDVLKRSNYGYVLRRLLQGLDDIDPEIMDAIPSAPFSREWADDYSLLDLYEEIGVDVSEVADYMTDVFADAFESAYADAVTEEIVRIAQYHLEK